jgi:hypothetical protein
MSDTFCKMASLKMASLKTASLSAPDKIGRRLIHPSWLRTQANGLRMLAEKFDTLSQCASVTLSSEALAEIRQQLDRSVGRIDEAARRIERAWGPDAE